MLRSTFLRAVPLLALLVPATFACTPVVHDVGSDDAGDGGKKPTDLCTGLIAEYCTGGVFLRAGCTESEATCVDGFVKCGQVTCDSQDAGACTLSAAMEVCHLPALGPGCTVGPNTCVGDKIECGQVTCPTGDAGPPPVDAGHDSGDGCDPASTFACGLGDYPPNCFIDRVCNDGQWSCGPVQCPDAGPDGSSPFNCGTINCDVGTEYCEVFPRCVAVSDSGPRAAGYMCKPIPGPCENADTCPCIADDLNGGGTFPYTTSTVNGACVITANCA